MDRTVFYKVEDRCFGRKKNQPKEREFSNEEQEHHLKFGFVGRLAGRVRYVLRECLWNKPKHLTLPNYFVRLNFGNCMVEDLESGLVTFNYEDAVFTKGSMSLPDVTVSYSEEDSSFTFALTPMAGREFPGKNASDEVHAILLESNGERPPEDVGGPGGYEEYLRIVSDPESPEYESVVEWSKMTRAKKRTIEEINRSLLFYH